MARKKALTTSIAQIEKQRKTFVPAGKRKKTHHLEGHTEYFAHTLDDEILNHIQGKGKRKGKRDGTIDILDLFDPMLDPRKGTYYMQWDEQTIKNFLFGRIFHHFRFLRTADWTKEPGGESYTAAEALLWICSEEFDQVCALDNVQIRLKAEPETGYEDLEDSEEDYVVYTIGRLDPNILRCAIPRIVRKYNRETAGTCKRLLEGLTRFGNWYFEQPNNHAKPLPAWILS